MAIMDGWRGIKETWPAAWLRAARLPSLSTLALTSLGGAAGHYLFAGITALPDAVPQRWQPVRVFRFGDLGASQVDRRWPTPVTLRVRCYVPGHRSVPDSYRNTVEYPAV